MRGTLLRHNYRWVVVLLATLLLVTLSQWTADALSRPANLGLRAAERQGRPVITWVWPGGLGWDAGIRPGDEVIAINGAAAAPGAAAAVSSAAAIEVQTSAGARLNASPATGSDVLLPTATWSLSLLALCFAAIGLLIFVFAADAWLAWSTLCITITMSATLLAGRATTVGAPWALVTVFCCLLGFGFSTLLLALVFPLRRLDTRAGRALASAGLLLTLALLGGYLWTIWGDSTDYNTVRDGMVALLGCEFAATCGFFGAAFVRLRRTNSQARSVLSVLLLSSIAALTPFCLFTLIPVMMSWPPAFSPDMTLLSIVLLPLGLAMAVFSEHFVAIRPAAYRVLVALVVWIGLIAVLSLAFTLLGYAEQSRTWLPSQALQALPVEIAIVAGVFGLVQRPLRSLLERLLFADVYSYADTLQRLSTLIAHYSTVEEIGHDVLRQLGNTMSLRWARITIQDTAGLPEESYTWGDAPPPGASRDRSAPGGEEPWRVVLHSSGITLGMLTLGPKRRGGGFTAQDQTFLGTLAPLVATGLQNALLIRRQQAQLAALEEREQALAALTARLMRLQEEERLRIALDLHDEPLQRALLLERELAEAPPTPSVQRWQQAIEDISISLRMICLDLRPPVLDDLGLVAGITWLINDLRARTDLNIEFEVAPTDQSRFERLERPLEIALYRVSQEVLNNCCKHAQASHVLVRLQREEGQVILEVIDDGRGFQPGPDGAQPMLNLGLLGIRERLRPWRSDITIKTAIGCGVKFHVVVTLDPSGADAPPDFGALYRVVRV